MQSRSGGGAFAPDAITRGDGEWAGVPSIVRCAFSALFASLDDLKLYVRDECCRTADWEDRWAEKAEVTDVYNNLKAKADVKVVADVTSAMTDRMADMTNRLNSLSIIVSDLQNVHKVDAKLASLDERVRFLATEIVKDRDEVADVHVRLAALQGLASFPPRKGAGDDGGGGSHLRGPAPPAGNPATHHHQQPAPTTPQPHRQPPDRPHPRDPSPSFNLSPASGTPGTVREQEHHPRDDPSYAWR